MQKDFSIKLEVKAMLENINMEMTEEQIDEVVEEIEQYDTFLSIVRLFVTKGIIDTCEKNKLHYDKEEIQYLIAECSRVINPGDLI